MDKGLGKMMLVVNPVSGNRDKAPIIDAVKDAVGDRYPLQVFKTTGKDDLAQLKAALQKNPPDRILVCGGDGTIKLAAEASEAAVVELGILPAGSSNGLATELDLPTDMEEAIVVALGTQTMTMDLLTINDGMGIHISDMGLNAELIQNYDESSMRGQWGYFVNSIPTLRETDVPYDFRIKTDTAEDTFRAIMVAFTHCRKYGTGALVNPNGQIDDGKFEVLIFKKLDIKEILKTLAGKTEMDPDFVEIRSTTTAHVQSAVPVHLQIDGEPQKKAKEVTVTISPKKLRVAVRQ
jgi:diacylglycerol kinase family enzyme